MTTALTNADIAAMLREIALFLSMEDEPFKPRAYEKAAESVAATDQACAVLFASGGAKASRPFPASARASRRKSASCSPPGR
jgi:DNA polymerase/3'-5' exonuclease PolX